MVKTLILRFKNSDFLRNILVLATGTGLAQLIPIFASLVLARLYSSVDFGNLSVFVSITGILGAIAAFRYELTIVLPKSDDDAINLVVITVLNTVVVSVLVFFVINFVRESYWCSLFNVDRFNLFIYIPIVVLFTGCFNALYNWFARNEKYKIMSISKLMQSMSTAGFKLIFGFLGVGSGLIYGHILGFVFSVLYLIYRFKFADTIKFVSLKKQVLQFKKYTDFFYFSTPSALANTFTSLGLPILISNLYGIELAGMYFFANTVVRIPINLLVQAITQVFKKKASVLYNNKDVSLLQLTLKIQHPFILIILPVILVLSIFGGDIFSFVFGEKWFQSGDIIKYFSIYLIFGNYFNVISSILDVLRLQRQALIFNISLGISQLVLFYFLSSFMSFNNVLLTVSIVGAIHFFFFDKYVKTNLKTFCFQN